MRRRPRVRLEPLQSGGGQERGLRSGTVPTPLAVGLGAACELAQQEMEVELLLYRCQYYIRETPTGRILCILFAVFVGNIEIFMPFSGK